MEKNEQIKRKLLSPKVDIVFQTLFGEEGSEKITKDFLEAILKEKIEEIDLNKNPILRRDLPKEKLGVLDVVAKINGKEYCNIEMQMVERGDIIERILFYWGKLYTRNIKKGEEYEKLEKTIIILITNKEIKQLKVEKYHTKWKIIEEKDREKILTDKFELHIIQLEGLKETSENNEDKLIDWLSFIINPESEGVKKKMEENEAIKEAKEKLDKISEDEKMQQIAWWREKAVYEEKSLIGSTLRKTKQEIAKNMKKEKEPIDKIIKFTGLTKEEIEKL